MTNFALKGYSGSNKVDITESQLPISDKNNLKLAGVAKEDIVAI